MEKSFAGTFPLIVGSAVVFSVISVPLWFGGRQLLKRSPVNSPRLLRVLLVGLTLPPVCFAAGLVTAFFSLFRGR
jgi:hypothetical protein